MKLIGVITNPSEVGTIPRHLIKTGRAPAGPGLPHASRYGPLRCAASLPPSSASTTAKRESCWNDRDQGEGQGRDHSEQPEPFLAAAVSHIFYLTPPSPGLPRCGLRSSPHARGLGPVADGRPGWMPGRGRSCCMSGVVGAMGRAMIRPPARAGRGRLPSFGQRPCGRGGPRPPR